MGRALALPGLSGADLALDDLDALVDVLRRRPGSVRSCSRGCRCRCAARCSRYRCGAARGRCGSRSIQSASGAEVGGAGGDQLDGRVDAAHGLGGFEGELGVVLGVLVAELPGAVDFVAEAPVLDALGLVAAVLAALLRPSRCCAIRWCTRPTRGLPRWCRVRR